MFSGYSIPLPPGFLFFLPLQQIASIPCQLKMLSPLFAIFWVFWPLNNYFLKIFCSYANLWGSPKFAHIFLLSMNLAVLVMQGSHTCILSLPMPPLSSYHFTACLQIPCLANIKNSVFGKEGERNCLRIYLFFALLCID